MKKRIVSILLLSAMCFSLASCGKNDKNEPVVDVIEVEQIIQSETSLPTPSEISRDEVVALSADEVKEFVLAYIPNYHEVFKMKESVNINTLSDLEIERIKDLIYYMLFDERMPGGESEANLIIKNIEDYVNSSEFNVDKPDLDIVRAMSTAEFAEYYNLIKDNYKGLDIDYTEQSDEYIEKIRKRYIAAYSSK